MFIFLELKTRILSQFIFNLKNIEKKSTLLVRNIKYTEILEFLKKLRIIELFQLNFDLLI